MIKVDTCGQSCPQPVLMTKKAIDKNPKEEIEVVTDNNTSTMNVKKFLSSNGYTVSVTAQDDETFIVRGNK